MRLCLVEDIAVAGLEPLALTRPAHDLRLGAGTIGRATRDGETWVVGKGDPAGALPAERNLTACIPLRVDGRVIGAIAIFRLLRHKRGLEDVDRELFALLSTQAAAALHFAARATASA